MFSTVAAPIYIPTNSVGGFPFLHTIFSIYYLQTEYLLFLMWSLLPVKLNRLQLNPDAAGMSLLNVNRLLTFILFSLCKIPIINSDLRDQTVNNVLILAYFQVMYCIISESYGRLILSLTNTPQCMRGGEPASHPWEGSN